MWTEGRTQRWLSRQTGIDEALISQYMNGRLHPRQKNASLIASALGRKADVARLFLAPDVR